MAVDLWINTDNANYRTSYLLLSTNSWQFPKVQCSQRMRFTLDPTVDHSPPDPIPTVYFPRTDFLAKVWVTYWETLLEPTWQPSKAVKNSVFWDVAPCTSCANRRFGGTYRLHHQGRKICERGTTVSRCLQTGSSLADFFYPEDGDTFLRNVGSHKIYTAPHPRRRHSS
jgi:hypothetical protein